MKHPYGAAFWWTYLANTSLMVAVSLLFRYADFVAILGGTEGHLGFITGMGMVGGILARCIQGVAIDRCGPRLVWLTSLFFLALGLLAHQLVSSIAGPTIHLLRVMYVASLAGAFGSSITFVSLRAPRERLAEMIGMLGSSGFVGMAIGPILGDWLLATSRPVRSDVDRMFVWSAVAVAISFTCAFVATRWDVRVTSSRRLPVLGLLWRYHPGPTLLVGVAMGVGIGMPGTFLRAYAAELGLAQIKLYFIAYSLTAFAVRIYTRRLADRWGNRPTILLGLICLGLSMPAYLVVGSQLTLVVPAVLGGTAHALLFPAAVAEGSLSFPIRYRGLATTLILTMFDVGLLVGQPAIGATVDIARYCGLNGYAAVFGGLAVVLLGVAGYYGVASLGTGDGRGVSRGARSSVGRTQRRAHASTSGER